MYGDARDQYYEKRRCCPKCGGTHTYETLACPFFDHEHPEAYKDNNDAQCATCGWHGKVHDMVGQPQQPVSTKKDTDGSSR